MKHKKNAIDKPRPSVEIYKNEIMKKVAKTCLNILEDDETTILFIQIKIVEFDRQKRPNYIEKQIVFLLHLIGNKFLFAYTWEEKAN